MSTAEELVDAALENLRQLKNAIAKQTEANVDLDIKLQQLQKTCQEITTQYSALKVVKPEFPSLVGMIKVRNLSSLLDPKRLVANEVPTIELSDSEDNASPRKQDESRLTPRQSVSDDTAESNTSRKGDINLKCKSSKSNSHKGKRKRLTSLSSEGCVEIDRLESNDKECTKNDEEDTQEVNSCTQPECDRDPKFYWKCVVNVTRCRLPSACDNMIRSASSKEQQADSSSPEENSSPEEVMSSDSDDVFTKRRRRIVVRTTNSDSDPEPEEPQKKLTKKRSRIKRIADDSSDEEEDKSTRKQIRKVIASDALADTTKQAAKEEAERKQRIADRQAQYNNIFNPKELESAELTKVVLDFNEETQEELLKVDAKIVKHLKPHQGKGVQFMWNACFESLDRARNTPGSGCVLAHCMGLGKTLQIVTLTHTLLANSEKTNVNRVLVVCPLSTVLNWVAEFRKWLPDDDEVQVFNLVAFKQNRERVVHLMHWHKYGGAMIMGYDMFRNMTNEQNKRMTKKMRGDLARALVNPGPDLVVCDEGHLLKNEKTSISKAMNKLRTLRRIVLTGTPLQNNLKEYYCMVQFVKPNLLGTFKEYLNRFVNPITNGQYTDSTQMDINIMRKRSHVLHRMLDGIVQRKDYSVLAPFLPPKHEYVVFITLTKKQQELYAYYLENLAQMRRESERTSFMFNDFQVFQRICTHPRALLQMNTRKNEKRWLSDEDSEGSLKDFIDDGDSDASTSTTAPSSVVSASGDEANGKRKKKSSKAAPASKRKTRADGAASDLELIEPEEAAVSSEGEWWQTMTDDDVMNDIGMSAKLSLLFNIIKECELIGDKILVFSQSLITLNVIEYFLSKVDDVSQENGDSSKTQGHSSSWMLGVDYFRLDGSSSCDNRALWCKNFNDIENTRARLFLISTRAGGLGINLVAANRVIIFDVSWNPSHDTQSVYRVYRFGQTKPCYIYRFVTMGVMEMKVYERQVTKQAISKRVIDEQQIDRHYNQHDLQELYKYEPEPPNRPPPVPPKDILFGELLQKHANLVYKYHEHQSLLENKMDEVLNEAERKAAWEEFENEKETHRNMSGTINNIPMHTVVQALASIMKRENAGLTALEINGVMPQLLQELRSQLANSENALFNKVLAEIRAIKMAEQARFLDYYGQRQQAWLLQQTAQQFPAARQMLSQASGSGNILESLMNAMVTAGMQRPRVTAPPAQGLPTLPNETEIVNLDDD